MLGFLFQAFTMACHMDARKLRSNLKKLGSGPISRCNIRGAPCSRICCYRFFVLREAFAGAVSPIPKSAVEAARCEVRVP